MQSHTQQAQYASQMFFIEISFAKHLELGLFLVIKHNTVPNSSNFVGTEGNGISVI